MESGGIKLKYTIKIWEPHFHIVFQRYKNSIVVNVIFILSNTNVSIEAKVSSMAKQV